MKNLLFTLFAILSIQVCSSQVKKIEYSTPFEEPTKGWYKVVQLSNGNTFFLNFNSEDGIAVTVYKPDRKLAARKVLSSNLWDPRDMKNSTMEGIYEIAGKPVIFLQQLTDRVPILYRIQLNPENGSIEQQKEIGRLPKYKLMAGYAMAFGVDQEDFIVEKDPYSDAYAVVHYNSFSKDANKRLEVVHYTIENGEHKETTRAFYDAQNFKYTNYIGMTVHGDKSITMAAYGYNTASSGDKDSRVIVSKINKGETQFIHKNLEFTEDFKETEGLMNYNPETGMIQLLTLTFLKQKNNGVNYYLPLISFIDPVSLQIIKKFELPMSSVNAYIKAKKVGDDDFNHLPINMILNNNNNTTTILLEEKEENAINSSSTEVIFGRIAVVTLDQSGKDIDAYALMKAQIATGHPTAMFYHAKRGKGLWSYVARRGTTLYTPDDNRSYYSFDYINTASNNTYIIYNDNPKNYMNGAAITDNDMKLIKPVSESVATYRKVINNMKMESGFLYGRNANDDATAFCNVESAHFRKETGVYASLMVKRNKKEKKAYISWVTLE